MKNWIFFLGSLLLTIAAVFAVKYWLGTYDHPGYVMIGVGSWSMESTLLTFIVGLIIGFYVLFLFFNFLGWLIRLPWHLKNRSRNIKFNRSQEALIAGLIGTAEGNWEQAEKVLIKHAQNSGAPLLHYLTAAKAAQSRGAYDKRDEYLKQATAKAPGSDVAIGLTQAELHLSANQFEQALATLTKLHSINAGHATVLKLMHQTYQHLGDWQGLRKLLPSLNKNKILMEVEIKKLEEDAFKGLLNQLKKQGNINEVRLLWSEIPNHIKKNPNVAAVYFATMIDTNLDAEIEKDLVEVLTINWDKSLLKLFAKLNTTDAAKQLAIAETWLPHHKNEALLLVTLGQISLKCQEYEKAEDYLKQSIALEPTLESYRLLGELYDQLGDEHKANTCYREGLDLATKTIAS